MEPPGGGANLGWRLLGGKTGWKGERHTVEGRERASRPPPFCVSPRYCRRRHGCALFDLTVPLLSHFQTQPRSCPTYDRSPINPTRAIIEDRPHHSDHRFCYTLTQLSLASSPRFSLTNANAVYRLGVSIPLIFDTSIEQPEDSTPWAPYSNHSFSVIIR